MHFTPRYRRREDGRHPEEIPCQKKKRKKKKEKKETIASIASSRPHIHHATPNVCCVRSMSASNVMTSSADGSRHDSEQGRSFIHSFIRSFVRSTKSFNVRCTRGFVLFSDQALHVGGETCVEKTTELTYDESKAAALTSVCMEQCTSLPAR